MEAMTELGVLVENLTDTSLRATEGSEAIPDTTGRLLRRNERSSQ